jgi:hypothetical protein
MVLVFLLLGTPIAGSENTELNDSPQARATFTHTVFVEDITATWCVYCPSSSAEMDALYESGNYDFYYVSMITQDENGETINDDAQQRANDYKISGYPTAMFDGGYEEVIGGQSDGTNYQNAIESCGARPVPDLDLVLTATYVPDQKIEVNVQLTNNNVDVYSGNLRIYIVEIESRYLDYDGNKYHYGFLDYAMNTNININPDETYENDATWDSLTATDTQGNSFGIPDPDNIMVFATVFNSERNIKTRVAAPPNNVYFAYYADETVAATLGDAADDKTPPTVSIIQPQNNDKVKGTVEIQAKATDNIGIQKVMYKVGTGTWLQMSKSGTDDIYTAQWDSTTASDGSSMISVEAYDLADNIDSESVSVQVSNSAPTDTTPPSITISSPKETETLSGIVSVIAVVTDDWGVSSVNYQVDQGASITMFALSTPGSYQASWDTSLVSDGFHTLSVNAADTSTNTNSESVYIKVDNSGTEPIIDTEPPTLVILEPDDGDTISGKQDLSVMAYDNKAIDKVECSIVFGANTWQQLTDVGGDEWNLDLDTNMYPDGNYDIIFRATDTSTNIATETISVIIGNEYKDFIRPSVKPLVPSNGDVVSGTFDIKVEASDNDEIDQVQYNVDSGAWMQMINTRHNTFTSSIDSKEYPNGKHTITVKAIDLAGNEELMTIDLEISNVAEKKDDSSPLPGFEGVFAIIALALVILLLNRKN